MSSTKGTLSAGRPSVKAGDKRKAATLASLSDEQPKKRVNFELSADQHAKLKVYAARQGKTVKELLTEYIRGLPEE
ncbi:chromosome partitioning protein ParB [uncultured Halomonas sp.]|uniref:chromosome partitioning protein ParB n=1 Tax=uncultured Halomonas sp. TaxID=173971 RepID=UPI0026233185|nr:chromosome partitioning protein ParB [uncultured Halomonas sp.]